MDSSVILDYLASVYPRIAALTPSKAPQRLEALRATGLALTVMEKAVQRHYERMLRPRRKAARALGRPGHGAIDRGFERIGR